MSEYEELIEILRDAEYCGKLDFVYDAADAIEQLVKERDAAVADLKQASKIPYGGCHLCTSIRTEICKECYRSDMFAEIAKNPTDHWEWRGVKEEALNDG